MNERSVKDKTLKNKMQIFLKGIRQQAMGNSVGNA